MEERTIMQPTGAPGSIVGGHYNPVAAGPSWVDNLIPTGASILGGIGGTLLGGPLGGIAGAGLGGALGKGAENALQGQNPFQANDITSGIEGAAGQGIGMGIGSVLGHLGGALAKPVENAAASTLQGQFANGTIDRGVVDYLKGMGVNSANQVGQIAPLVTGSNGALSSGLRSALESVEKPVDITGLDNLGNAAIANEVGLKPAYRTDIANTVQDTINKMVGEDAIPVAQRNGQLTFAYSPGALQNVLPEKSFTAVQDLEKAASEQFNKAYDKMGNITNGDAYSAGKIFNQLADELENRTFGVGGEALPLTDEAKSAIVDKLSPLQDINPTFYNKLIEQVQNTPDIQSLRPMQSNLVQASKALNATNLLAGKRGGQTAAQVAAMLGRGTAPISAAVASGTPHGLAAALGGFLVSHPAADRFASSGLSKLADTLKSMGDVQDAAKLGSYSKASLGGGALGSFLGTAPNFANNGAPTGSALSLTQGASSQGNQPMNPQAQLAGGLPLSTIGLSQQLDRMLAVDPYLASSLVPSLSSLVPQAQALQAAGPEMAAYQSTLGQAGAGQGPFGGLLSLLGGYLTGGPAAQAPAQQAALQQLLKQAGVPMAVPGMLANQAGLQAGFGPSQNVLSTLGAY